MTSVENLGNNEPDYSELLQDHLRASADFVIQETFDDGVTKPETTPSSYELMTRTPELPRFKSPAFSSQPPPVFPWRKQ